LLHNFIFICIYFSHQDDGDGPDAIQTIVNKIMNKTIADHIVSKQEAMVELGGLDLIYCTKKFDRISISGM
jgi:hypothetical protein